MVHITADDFDLLIEDNARILCWTNQATKYSKMPGVKEYNLKIRSMLFGQRQAEESDIYPTDRILFSSPLFKVKNRENVTLETLNKAEFSIVASINTRAEVLKAEKCTQFGIECWEAELEIEGGKNEVVYIPTKKGEEQKRKVEQEIVTRAKEAGTGKEAGALWNYFHSFRQLFCEFKHTYCVTTHRAQGSTISSVFVDTGNILQNRDRLVAFKSLYVAATRAANRLALVL